MYVTVTKGLEGLRGFTGRRRDGIGIGKRTLPEYSKKGPNTKNEIN